MATDSSRITAPIWGRSYDYHNKSADKREFPSAPAAPSGFYDTTPSAHSYHQPSARATSRVDEQGQTHQLPSVTDPYTDASNYRSRSGQRHTPPCGNLTATSPPGQRFTSPWHSLPLDHRALQKQIAPAPLTLQIPDAQELPRISTDIHPYSGTPISRQQTTTSLPSFASFKEHASRDEPDEVEIAPMSARISCYLCTKLKPFVRDIAIAVAELDENVQTCCNKSTTRALNIPKDDPERLIQWVLERLAQSKGDLQEAARRGQQVFNPQLSTPFSGIGAPNAPSPNLLKRPAWDHDDLPEAKRRQSVISLDTTARTFTTSGFKDDRRGSVDFATRSPQPSESVPGSAYPRTGSPGFAGRLPRALPSPSSVAYPSAAASFAPHTAPSRGSPTNSYQPTVSIHTASTSSATSAHIADLQHQVTLKSLALQTLQSEYSSLLQKLQREKVKSQAIEKKTTVADQEVNDLTTRGEELIDQVKSLEAQLEASEKKREDDRAQASREKDQWQRMLELGGRIQSKHSEDKQKLRDECDSLAQRLAAYESDGQGEPDRSRPTVVSDIANSFRPNETGTDRQMPKLNSRSSRPVYGGSNDVEDLQHEIGILQSRIEVLRYALEEAQRHNSLMNSRASELVQRTGQVGDVVQRALEEGQTASRTLALPQSPIRNDAEQRTERQQRGEHQVTNPGITNSHEAAPEPSGQESAQGSRKASQSTASSSATMASVARAVSPGPAELGFHVMPSTSSPEELIQALGPVPAPIPATSLPFTAPLYGPVLQTSKKPSGSKRAKQARRQSAEIVGSWMLPRIEEHHDAGTTFQIGGFRPLSHDLPAGVNALLTNGVGEHSPPHSYHSSPGPMRDGTSPGSTGSADGSSPRGRPDRPRKENTYHPTIASSHVSAELQKFYGPGHAAAMPPPPRPSLHSAGSAPILPTSYYEKRSAV